MMQSDAPDPFMHFMIGGKARDLLALLPELKKALNGGSRLRKRHE